ncbi:MAG: dipeptide epimerase, partial [Muribaculaceae bacterium]|nr:dipeptide epimerase [Muribaculaceae bacterium]
MDRRNFLRTGALGALFVASPISMSVFGQNTATTHTGRSGRLNLKFEPYELQLRHGFNLAKSQRTTTPDVQVTLEYD